MAFGLVPVVAFDLSTVDSNGNIGRNTLNFPIDPANPVSIAVAIATAEAAILAQGALTNGIIQKCAIRFELDDPDLAGAVPPGSSDVERKGSFTFDLANRQTAKVEVPSINPNFVIDGTNVIGTDALATIPNAFIALILNGSFGPNNGAVTAGGVQYTRFRKAQQIHRRSNKG